MIAGAIKTSYYGRGGYITIDISIFLMNTIPKAVLESKIIETVLDFYSPYLKKSDRQKFADAIKAQTPKKTAQNCNGVKSINVASSADTQYTGKKLANAKYKGRLRCRN